MLHSHLFLLVVFSSFVAVVFATLMRDDVTERLKLGIKMFGGLVLGAIMLGWLMFPFPI